MLMLVALGVTAVIVVSFIVVYVFAQQQNDRAKIQQLAEEYKKRQCASIASSPDEYLNCIRR